MSVEPVDFADAADLIAEHGDWTECQAFRFIRDGNTVRLQISHQPPCEHCRAKGRLTAVGPQFKTETYDCMQCGGLGRRPAEGSDES